VRRQVGPRTGGASGLWSPGRRGSIEWVGLRKRYRLGYVRFRTGQWVGKLWERLGLGYVEQLRVGERLGRRE
jgi:hypothetical protein